MKIIFKSVKVRVEKYYNNVSVVMFDYYFVFIIDREDVIYLNLKII